MIGYCMLGSKDIVRAKRFYDDLLAILGASHAPWSSDKQLFYAVTPGGPMLGITPPFDGGEAMAGNGTMVALIAPTRAVVGAVFAKALDLGGRDEGAPGIRGKNPNGFYGAYFRDLDGNKLCIFRLGPPDAEA